MDRKIYQNSSKSTFPDKEILFITGTDTGVGKTYLSIIIIKGMKRMNINVIPYKPVETGVKNLKESDSFKLAQATEGVVNNEEINIYRFKEAITPSLACKMHSVKITLKEIVERAEKLKQKGDILLIEGAGGILSPLSSFGWSEVIKELGAKVIMVVGNKLGCINHSALTEKYLLSQGITHIGWIMNNPQRKTSLAQKKNLEVLKETLESNFIAEVPFMRNYSPAFAEKLAKKILNFTGTLLKHSSPSDIKE